MTIGERIRCIRKKAGLTQSQFAEKCGIAAITVHQYESGKRSPRYDQIEKIACALDVSPFYLFGSNRIASDLLDIVEILKSQCTFLEMPLKYECLPDDIKNKLFVQIDKINELLDRLEPYL